MRPVLSAVAAIAVVAASLGIFASPAAAHERRTVGPYAFVVGWLSEPSYSGLLNGLDLTVTETATGKAVEGLEKTLRAEIVSGGGASRLALALASRFGLPGKYQGQVVPTRTGDYVFHISGTVGTTSVDEKFESGPNRFGGIEDTAALQFPDKVPSAIELSRTLDDVNRRLTIAIGLAGVALLASIASLGVGLRRR
ncbi:MAG TPA: hypothetical protein VHG53_01720 [Candidatus Limnocylindria bacterium]|nr:hypothetical protein [Candidatus Limnocylindria bacterium]